MRSKDSYFYKCADFPETSRAGRRMIKRHDTKNLFVFPVKMRVYDLKQRGER